MARNPKERGFDLWIPPVASVYEHGLPVYEIIGHDAQIVQFPLKAGRSITCVAGAMAYMSPTIKMEVKFDGLEKTFERIAGGGSIFKVIYTNESEFEDGYISMTPDYPGVIIPVDMKEHTEIVALRDSYLCSTIPQYGEETQVGADLFKPDNILAFCCGGFDFIVQTIEQGEWAFLVAMGTVITKTLAYDEKMLVHSDSILCFDKSVGVDVKAVGRITAMCCAGEGIFYTELTGPGKVWMQSMSIDKLRKLLPPQVVQIGEDSGGDGPSGAFSAVGAVAAASAGYNVGRARSDNFFGGRIDGFNNYGGVSYSFNSGGGSGFGGVGAIFRGGGGDFGGGNG